MIISAIRWMFIFVWIPRNVASLTVTSNLTPRQVTGCGSLIHVNENVNRFAGPKWSGQDVGPIFKQDSAIANLKVERIRDNALAIDWWSDSVEVGLVVWQVVRIEIL